MRNLVGLYAPLPTPFTDDTSSISEVRLARLIRHFLSDGVQGFVIGSAAGEFTTLTLSERKHLLELVQRLAPGAPIIVHATCLQTTATLDLAQHASRHGAQMVVITPPLLGDFTDAEVHKFISFVAHHAGIPTLVTDPHRRVVGGLHDQLLTSPTVKIATPCTGTCAFYPEHTHSDQFTYHECIVSPVITISPWRMHPSSLPHWLPEPLRTAGTARVIKAAMEMQGFECGPLRGPQLALDPALRKSLSDFLAHDSAA